MTLKWMQTLCAAAIMSLGLGAATFAEDKAPAKEDNYPLETCVVSGEKLGSMGEAVAYKHEGRTVKFCCSHCVGTFKEDPAKYLKKLDEAAAKKDGATTQPAEGHEGHNH